MGLEYQISLSYKSTPGQENHVISHVVCHMAGSRYNLMHTLSTLSSIYLILFLNTPGGGLEP